MYETQRQEVVSDSARGTPWVPSWRGSAPPGCAGGRPGQEPRVVLAPGENDAPRVLSQVHVQVGLGYQELRSPLPLSPEAHTGWSRGTCVPHRQAPGGAQRLCSALHPAEAPLTRLSTRGESLCSSPERPSLPLPLQAARAAGRLWPTSPHFPANPASDWQGAGGPEEEAEDRQRACVLRPWFPPRLWPSLSVSPGPGLGAQTRSCLADTQSEGHSREWSWLERGSRGWKDDRAGEGRLVGVAKSGRGDKEGPTASNTGSHCLSPHQRHPLSRVVTCKAQDTQK